jgi:hypothetical protein
VRAGFADALDTELVAALQADQDVFPAGETLRLQLFEVSYLTGPVGGGDALTEHKALYMAFRSGGAQQTALITDAYDPRLWLPAQAAMKK